MLAVVSFVQIFFCNFKIESALLHPLCPLIAPILPFCLLPLLFPTSSLWHNSIMLTSTRLNALLRAAKQRLHLVACVNSYLGFFFYVLFFCWNDLVLSSLASFFLGFSISVIFNL